MRLSWIPLVFALAACSTSLAGEYDLQTMDGERLPVPFFDGQLTAVELQLHDDDRCVARIFTSGGDTDVDDACTWTVEDATLTLVMGDGEHLSGTSDEGTLSLTGDDGTPYVFVRR